MPALGRLEPVAVQVPSGGWIVPEIVHSTSASGSQLVMMTVTSYVPIG